MGISAIGIGMYVPFSLVFFHHVTGLSFALVGVVLTVTGLAGSAAPEAVRGRYLATSQLSYSLASALAPSLFTALLSVDGRLPWAVLTGAALGAALALTRLERRLPAEAVYATPPAAAATPTPAPTPTSAPTPATATPATAGAPIPRERVAGAA
ncbi:hypothetical protein [Streptomyces sp. H27-H5]|uniref:hypothetical protein n=1 Tax=Streptomyces sp. H27-H5 TaxID=2996460 RepID=UPI0022702B01|nr:hypothetical protein [Streptomyces sp. H27-H5]MCY0958921.1 hypothetical protein [Streptomyces sp. H27-H5]